MFVCGLCAVLTASAPALAPAADPASSASIHVDRYGDPLPPGAIGRIGCLRFHQGGSINCIFPSPDGRLLISNSVYGNPKVFAWDRASGKPLHEFPGNYEYKTIAVSSDGRILATPQGQNVELWDIHAGTLIRKFQADNEEELYGLAFSPDGKMLASGGSDRRVRLWNAQTGKLKREIGLAPTAHQTTLLAFTPDGRKIVAADHLEKWISVFDVSDGKLLHALQPKTFIRCLSVSPDRASLITGGEGAIPVWNIATGRLVREIPGDKTIMAVAFSPDGKSIAVSSGGGEPFSGAVSVFDALSGKVRWRSKTSPPWGLAFAANGKTLFTGSPRIRSWSVADGTEQNPVEDMPEGIGSISVSPDGGTIASTATALWLWDTKSLRRVSKIVMDDPIWDARFSPDGKWIATSAGKGAVQVLDRATGKPTRKISLKSWARSVDFSQDGKSLLTVSGDGDLQQWDIAGGREMRCFTKPASSLGYVTYSRAGSLLAAVDMHEEIHFWDTGSGKELDYPTGQINTLEEEPEPAGQPRGFRPQMLFNPDGKMLITSRCQSQIHIWEMASGKQRLRLGGQGDWIEALAITPDGRTLASSSWDRTIRLWDARTGAQLSQFEGHRGHAHSLAFAPDSTRLYSGGQDGTILVWDVAGLTSRQDRGLRLGATNREKCWELLRADDATKAYAAINQLIADPGGTVPALAKQVTPVMQPRPELITKLVQQLDSESFSKREEASEALSKFGDGAMSVILAAMGARPPSLELKQRVDSILNGFVVPTGNRLRELRAIEVLERIGTADAQHVLTQLAAGASEARLTREARAARDRLAKHHLEASSSVAK